MITVYKNKVKQRETAYRKKISLTFFSGNLKFAIRSFDKSRHLGGSVENSESSHTRSGARQPHATRHQGFAQRNDAHC